MDTFSPRLEILPPPQKRLWKELAAVPRDFVLYGGTALALHLGHRDSIDFDFFSNRALDLSAIEHGISFLAGARVIQREENTFSAIVERGGRIQVSFFGVPRLPRLAPVHVAKDNGLQIASLLDLAGTKVSVLQLRAEAKDYIDVDALLRSRKIDLPTALAAGRELYGRSFNPELTLKALSYFGDGNLQTLPEEMKDRLAAAAREIDVSLLPTLDRSHGRDDDLGS